MQTKQRNKMETKTCGVCGLELSEEKYYSYPPNKNGAVYLYSWCKDCHYVKTQPIRKKWVKKNPERSAGLNRKGMRAYIKRDPAGVYIIHTDKGSYVGSSSSIEIRITQLKNPRQKGPLTTNKATYISHTVLEYIDERHKRRQREKYYTKLLQPELNWRNLK